MKLPEDVPTAFDKSQVCRLAVGREQVDVWRFHDLCVQARKRPDLWEEAVGLWPDGATSQLPDEHPAYRLLEQNLRRGLHALAARRIAAGDANGGEDLLRRLLKYEPENEQVWLTLIELTLERSRPAAVLVLRDAETAMKDLGIDADRIGRQGRDLIQATAISQTPEVRVPAGRSPAPVHRPDEVKGILGRLRRAAVVGVDGAPGTGKSWLGTIAAEGSGYEVVRWTFGREAAAEAGPLIGAIADHVARSDIEVAARPVPGSADAIAEAFDRVPSLLLLDDIHRAVRDSATMAFLSRLFDRLRATDSRSRVIVIGRTVPARLLGEDIPVTVGGCTEKQCREFVSAAGVRLTDRRFQQLHLLTAGNIALLRLFVKHVLHHADGEADVDRALSRPSTCKGVYDYVLANHLGEVTSVVFPLVLAMSVVRTPLPVSSLWEAARGLFLPPIETVELLVRQHVLETVPGTGRSYRLAASVRAVLLDTMLDVDASAQHAIAADLQRASGRIGEQLHHLRAAGPTPGTVDIVNRTWGAAVVGGFGAELLDVLNDWPVAARVAYPRIALVRHELTRSLTALGGPGQHRDPSGSAPGAAERPPHRLVR
ncbi:AAA family ATPase [Nocardia amamiensis]|uniref:AAA family ATPase n=1 Tax=Nocardia amamiensis TaxID=404578 RepID=UPI0012F4A7DF|nr:AAA family ATPase [Nocardia amamiensis]